MGSGKTKNRNQIYENDLKLKWGCPVKLELEAHEKRIRWSAQAWRKQPVPNDLVFSGLSNSHDGFSFSLSLISL
ncbi:hypothetical protein HOLDEFILI_03830 [Holdemania filiformis DSM 12042]|uniref:Uncharacterized protein n=1 Tax=Holdemania filiformis DSM 12042 TaxID=545696 RepID=B9YDB4_9FIRM|nr:hypothetical protein HOLDEFILI_03830 [Holdemania filiformis DSM 12042]